MGSSELLVTVGIQDRASLPCLPVCKRHASSGLTGVSGPLSASPRGSVQVQGRTPSSLPRRPRAPHPSCVSGPLPGWLVLLSSCSEEQRVEVTSPSRLLAPWPATRPGTWARPRQSEPAVAPRAAQRRGWSSCGPGTADVAAPQSPPRSPPTVAHAHGARRRLPRTWHHAECAASVVTGAPS